MRLVCPACAAGYDVPDELLRPGRRTRCVHCGEIWTPPAPPPPEPVSAAPAEPPVMSYQPPPEPQQFDRLVPAVRPAADPRSTVWIGWLATVVVLAALGWAATTYRSDVMRVWPPSIRVYAALGLRG